MRLIATHFWNPPGPSMRARCTLAMPPTPISSTTRYLPRKNVAGPCLSASLARRPEDDGVPALTGPPWRDAAGRGGGGGMVTLSLPPRRARACEGIEAKSVSDRREQSKEVHA